MSIQCKLAISGTPVESSVYSFTKSVNKIANATYIKRYQNTLNKQFQQYIRDNMYRAGMEGVEDLEKTFFMSVIGNSIVFGTTEPLIANKYEYGWEDDDDYEDEYTMSTSPRYYIRPAIERIARELGAQLLRDMYQEYDKESHNAGYSSYIIADTKSSSYFNKYSGIL